MPDRLLAQDSNQSSERPELERPRSCKLFGPRALDLLLAVLEAHYEQAVAAVELRRLARVKGSPIRAGLTTQVFAPP